MTTNRLRVVAPWRAQSATLQRLVDAAIEAGGPAQRLTGLPTVSVVVPSYNQARFLARTLNSLINQRYPKFEIIVVDGGSEDQTREVLEQYDLQIFRWVSEPDDGQSDALNKGFAMATGEILGWMNADDLYLPHAVSSAVALFAAHPDVEVVFGDHLEIDADDRVVGYTYSFPGTRGHLVYEGFFANAQAMFWRREVHDRAGGFDPDLHRTMDYDLMLRLVDAAEGPFMHTPQPLACFRRHPQQKTKGYDETVDREHKRIAQRSAPWKYTPVGRLLRKAYRMRRLYWYWRRGGTGLVVEALTGRGGKVRK